MIVVGVLLVSIIVVYSFFVITKKVNVFSYTYFISYLLVGILFRFLKIFDELSNILIIILIIIAIVIIINIIYKQRSKTRKLLLFNVANNITEIKNIIDEYSKIEYYSLKKDGLNYILKYTIEDESSHRKLTKKLNRYISKNGKVPKMSLAIVLIMYIAILIYLYNVSGF